MIVYLFQKKFIIFYKNINYLIYVFSAKIVSDFDSSLWEDYYFIKFFGEKLGIEYFNLKMEVLYVKSYSYVENKRRC